MAPQRRGIGEGRIASPPRGAPLATAGLFYSECPQAERRPAATLAGVWSIVVAFALLLMVAAVVAAVYAWRLPGRAEPTKKAGRRRKAGWRRR